MTTSSDCKSIPVRQLYENLAYPDMSHPVMDPAVTGVAALLGGLTCVPPSHARILEIGCAGGHNLLPLAQRWPHSQFVGIDFAENAISRARHRAIAAGIFNISFQHTDLLHYDPPVEFDYIIAHGFFSWVPDEVKAALFKFCQRHLAPSGIATISFNLRSGWARRAPVIELVRHLCQSLDCDEMAAISLLLNAAPTSSAAAGDIRWILEDMLAKGPAILPFDDFSPLNDPWALEQFVTVSSRFGLTWLGEADPAENLPSALDDTSRNLLASISNDPMGLQSAADLLVGRTFRAGVLRRTDAPVHERFSAAALLDLAVRSGTSAPPPDHPAAPLYHVLAALGPQCHPVSALSAALPEIAPPQLARLLFEAISRGIVRPRIEPVPFDPQPPEFPCLDPLRLLYARERLPVVDAFHVPCSFPVAHYEVLAAMDGKRSQGALLEISRSHCPELDFEPWLAHLAGRGMFQTPPATSR
jgi:SAM-dependent methyltransferase